jgi:hypothetical protein
MFTALASHDQIAAASAWNAFTIITSGFYGFGNFSYGLMMLIAGWVIVSKKELPVGAGVVGLLAGIATLLGVFTSGTSLAVIGFIVYMPSLVLAIIFDFWAGLGLLKSRYNPDTSA